MYKKKPYNKQKINIEINMYNKLTVNVSDLEMAAFKQKLKFILHSFYWSNESMDSNLNESSLS